MVEALVVKIFYFVVAIFSVVMIFLAAQDPYLANVLKIDTKISNMQINDVIDYEINSTKISGVYEADELNRYNDKDEFLSFKAKILRGNLKHFLSSDKAISQNDEIIFQKNAVRGLTTAAGVWVTAAIGLACGAGMYLLATISTILVLVGMEAFNYVLRQLNRLHGTDEEKTDHAA